MRIKTLGALSHVLVGLVAAYTFLPSEKKTTDLAWLSMGLMIACEGLRMLLEDQNDAAANVFRRIRNGLCIVALVVMSWSLLSWF